MLYKEILENTPVGAVTLTTHENYLVRLDFSLSVGETFVKYLTKHFGKNEVLAKAKIRYMQPCVAHAA